MAKHSVIYTADKDDSPVSETADHRFFDGVPVELDDEIEADAHFLAKVPGNRFFHIVGQEKKPVVKAAPKKVK